MGIDLPAAREPGGPVRRRPPTRREPDRRLRGRAPPSRSGGLPGVSPALHFTRRVTTSLHGPTPSVVVVTLTRTPTHVAGVRPRMVVWPLGVDGRPLKVFDPSNVYCQFTVLPCFGLLEAAMSRRMSTSQSTLPDAWPLVSVSSAFERGVTLATRSPAFWIR